MTVIWNRKVVRFSARHPHPLRELLSRPRVRHPRSIGVRHFLSLINRMPTERENSGNFFGGGRLT